jgi:hypothetical protein
MKTLDYKMLSDGEKELVLAARPKKLRKLDEDELLDLHKRARRARNKYAKLHRRRASDQVGADKARGKAAKKQARVAAKAEVFEDVLSRVSRRLAVVAHEQAEQLRDERLSAARPTHKGSAVRPRPAAKGSIAPKGKHRRARDRRAIEQRTNAANRSAKRRHQARRANR